jgi:cyclohexa-1,5-dienecarbonyl-CoA hydratase
MLNAFHRACVALWELDVPTVARVHGAALGGGAELTLMCDLVWAAESAAFGFPEIRLGVLPPVAAVTLAARIPAHVAAEMILTGRPIDARAAERFGLANRVVPDAELDRELEQLLRHLTALSASSLRAAKQAMRLARLAPLPAAIAAAEAHYLGRLLDDPDAIEGLNAFLAKRPPHWGGN